MNHLENRLMRGLEWEEMEALMQMGKLIEKAFKSKIYKITVNGDINDMTRAHGVMVSFNYSDA